MGRRRRYRDFLAGGQNKGAVGVRVATAGAVGHGNGTVAHRPAAPDAPAAATPSGGEMVMANFGLDAGRLDDGWAAWVWPTLEPRDEYGEDDLQVIWRRARMLYHNCPGIRAAVHNMVNFTGELTPLPQSADADWNDLAAEAFRRATAAPARFDVAGRVNFLQAQRMMERAAIVDGDVAVVPLRRPEDGSACFAFYRAPQVSGGGQCGVELDAHGAARAYFLTGADGKAVRVEASSLMLYQHQAESGRLRGVSELVAAIRHGQDIRELVGYTKQAAKLAASFGLVETKLLSDKSPGIGANVGAGARLNAPSPDLPVKEVLGMGVKITSLAPGRDLKTITDNRPSQQVQQFIDHLIGCIAWSVGLDPEVLFFGSRMGSAAVRFSLEKLKAWQRERHEDRRIVLDRVWCHVVSCEMAAGRLRPCRSDDWWRVRWVPSRDMTIDLGRVSASTINLVHEGLADADEWTLATVGKTYKQVIRDRVAGLAYARGLAEQAGVPFELLCPGGGGGSGVPEGALPPPAGTDDEDEDGDGSRGGDAAGAAR